MLMMMNLIIAEPSPAVELLHKFSKAYQTRDWKKIEFLFTKKTFNFGTGKDEILDGREAMKRQCEQDWSQSKEGSITLHEPIHGSGNWASCTWTATITLPDGSTIKWENLRITVVAEQEDGEWKIAHSHASCPSAEQDDGHSFPIKQ